ncbi:hypothetical protein [Sporosarcina pasteurii]|uniref:Acid-resistance membrane protein n=1 Tax=Sporosarcina pasteurii TaxID=1474 RepID=A0A380BTX5_SPOPA|nr:hypothetical protein [Sporosarcina pasteurii]MDS9471256.1 hypothetical protein [Sporosarcina pasteurii]QBQ05112.1 hypothetical protein E2C16_05250 [Sporosarcina pasteurii]SUJ06459.1 Uncharacterised protein [Sporosarcina pasteurii]
MVKNFIFTALLLNMIATYLSFNVMKKSRSKQSFFFTTIGFVLLIMMVGLTIDLFFNPTPILLHAPFLIWMLFILSILLEIYSVFKRIIPGQLLAASLLLFLVIPTILSMGIFFLILAIIELVIAFILFQKTRDLGIS